jgi:hypothetical protein
MKIGQLINSLIVIAAALAVGSWSLMANPAESAKFSQEWTFEGSAVFGEHLIADEDMSIIRNGRDSVLLLAGSEAEITWDEETRHADVLLTKGGVLFATQANDFSVSVHTSTVRVDSQESLAYVELNENGDVSVFGLSHPSLLTFTENGEELNALFVPNGMMIEVPESKVSTTLSRLRLTKLSKEFRASEWSSDDFSDSVTTAWMDVKLRYTESSVLYSQGLQSDPQLGPVKSGLGGQVHTAYSNFRDLATFLPSAEERLIESRKDNMLIYAMSNLLNAESEAGEAWINDWSQEEHSFEDLESLYSDLFFVLPGDDLYTVKASVIQLTFDQDSTFSSLRRQFLDVESLVARGESINAQSSLQEYQASMTNALESGVFDDPDMLASLSREYLLVEVLLRENSNFYNVQYVDLLSSMEDKILDLAGGDTDLAEERQAFVLSKIQFLTKLFDYVIDRRVSVDDASDLANELLYTAEGYMTLIPDDVAVRDWYVSELEKADLAIAFINSPEFYSYADFDEGLEAYAAKVKDLEDLQDYIQQIRDGSGDVAEIGITLDEAEAEVREAFTFEAISYVKTESQGDAGYRLFDIIGGSVDLYSFEASYDREGGLLYDLVIEDQIRFSTGVLLEDLRNVIEQALVESPLEEDLEEDLVADTGSLTEDLAVHQVKAAFESAGLDVEKYTFEVLDVEENTFQFEGTITRYSLPITGQYSLNDNEVLEVTWTFDETDQSLPDMDLSQVEDAITAVYEALN